MKTTLLKQKILLVCLLASIGQLAWAYDFELNGIYYNKVDDSHVAVTYKSKYSSSNKEAYIGDIVIPTIISYSGNTYIVSSIESSAFSGCIGMTSITIP